jgi:hypothetical protein
MHIPCKSNCIWSCEKEIKHCTSIQGIFHPPQDFLKSNLKKTRTYKILIKTETIFKVLKIVLNGLNIDLAWQSQPT